MTLKKAICLYLDIDLRVLTNGLYMSMNLSQDLGCKTYIENNIAATGREDWKDHAE